MLARLNIGKIHTSFVLAALSLLGLALGGGLPGASPSQPQPFAQLQERQSEGDRPLVPMPRVKAEAAQVQEALDVEPRRLDLLRGASGQPIDPRSIFSLASSIGTGFGKLVAEQTGYGLEVKEPGGAWSRIPVVHFDKGLVLMRHGKDCVRLEDPQEPTANYYGICMLPEGVTIHTVGEVDSFS